MKIQFLTFNLSEQGLVSQRQRLDKSIYIVIFNLTF